jgi:hypothetical protein
MDMIAAINTWEIIGGDFNSIDEGEGGAYITQFIWKGKVEGYTKAVPGGIHWDWPQRLLDIAKAKREVFEKYHINKYSWFVKYSIGSNGVDCWFEDFNGTQHRCLTLEDFESIKCLSRHKTELV